MHFIDNVIAFIGPACAFALEPVARLAGYWNTPIITGMGDQVSLRMTFIFQNADFLDFIFLYPQ
jgi:Receptor family ligand binding region